MNYKFLSILAFLSVSMWLDFISILTYVGYELELSAFYVALVSISMLLPQAFLGKLLAKIVNKYDAQTVLVWSTIGRIVCTVALVWIDSIYVLLIVLLVRAFFLGLLQPIIASQAKKMAKSQGGRFSSILNMINTISKIAAPSLGGIFALTLGERYVFVLSGLLAFVALVLILANPLKSSQSEKKAGEEASTSTDLSALLPFSLVILFISGLSAMYTNLIPYAFNFYSVPKLTLSVALSTSAIAGLLFNLYIIKKNPQTNGFPMLHFFNAWILSAVFFTGLTLSMLTGKVSLVLIPLSFAGITVARAYFEVFSNSYIYSHDSREAIRLATYKQSLVSVVGIGATVFGAIAFSYVEPFQVLLTMAAVSMLICFVWILVFRGRQQVLYSK